MHGYSGERGIPENGIVRAKSEPKLHSSDIPLCISELNRFEKHSVSIGQDCFYTEEEINDNFNLATLTHETMGLIMVL